MIGTFANLAAGGVSSQSSVVAPVAAPAAAQTAGAERARRFFAPAPLISLPYCGRVSTFYSAVRGTYCETYEPARQADYGPVSRIESRLVGGQWRHFAYHSKGQPVASGDNDLLLLDHSRLPLMFDPAGEVEFAWHWLSSVNGPEVVELPQAVTVYGNKDRSSLGIVRLKVNSGTV